MTMLIKGGFIHTMTAQGSYEGDILVREDRIVAVAPQIDLPQEDTACVLDASGLTILPGMTDIHIHDNPENDGMLLRSPHASGVTCGLLWPEGEGQCRIITPGGEEASPIHALQTSDYSDSQFFELLNNHMEAGSTIACEIHSAHECRRVLEATSRMKIKAILVHLTGCEEILGEVAHSGCPAVIGVNHNRRGNPWKMACMLNDLGASVSLTCNYPDAKLCHLPLCAALCVREGLDRESALRMVTTAPGGLLKRSGAGVIAAGSQADIVIYDGDPLLLATSHVMTISGGKIRH